MNYNYKKYIWIIIIILGLGLGLGLGLRSVTEGFTPLKGFIPWPKDLIQRFELYQSTINQNSYQYNMYILQQQASADEAESLIKTGYWPWSDEIKDLYIKAVWQSPMIKIDPGHALTSAMKLYNETAAKRLLGWNAKEGQFLIYGVDAGRTGTMPVKNNIKCSSDLKNSVLQKNVYSGYNLWNGYKNGTTTNIKDQDIPSEVPGFSFVNGTCNPCVAINEVSEYTCPFKLEVPDRSDISPIWSNLWGL